MTGFSRILGTFFVTALVCWMLIGPAQAQTTTTIEPTTTTIAPTTTTIAPTTTTTLVPLTVTENFVVRLGENNTDYPWLQIVTVACVIGASWAILRAFRRVPASG